MTDALTLEILGCDPDQRVASVWTALKTRSEEREDVHVETNGDADEDWASFHWGSLGRVEIKGYGSRSTAERAITPDVPHVAVRYPTAPFEDAVAADDASALAEATVDLLNLAEFVYGNESDRPDVVYGVGQNHQERLLAEDLPPPVSTHSLALGRVEYACWLLVVPPSVADTYGRDRILSTPVWQTEPLPDGGASVIATRAPLGRTKPETRAIESHLDVDPPEATEDVAY